MSNYTLSHSVTLYTSSIPILCNFSNALSSFMLQHNCKRKTQMHCQETLNAKKFNGHSLFPFFLLGQLVIFILNNHFFKHPIQLIMTFFLFVYVEAINVHQWSKCIVIFFIHPYAIIATCPFILHFLHHVYYDASQLINKLTN